jgi:hypothetical protein
VSTALFWTSVGIYAGAIVLMFGALLWVLLGSSRTAARVDVW